MKKVTFYITGSKVNGNALVIQMSTLDGRAVLFNGRGPVAGFLSDPKAKGIENAEILAEISKGQLTQTLAKLGIEADAKNPLLTRVPIGKKVEVDEIHLKEAVGALFLN